MADQPKTVSELFPSKWLKPRDLPQAGRVAMIEGYDFQEFRRPDGAKEKGLVLRFRNATKGLILNQTQAGALVRITGSEAFADWVGCRVLLKPGKAANGKDTVVIEAAPVQTDRAGNGK
jgi:hypothetical protein